jgi:hypothetical protein
VLGQDPGDQPIEVLLTVALEHGFTVPFAVARGSSLAIVRSRSVRPVCRVIAVRMHNARKLARSESRTSEPGS